MYDELDVLVRREMERGRLPGLAIALVRDDEIVWSRGYGYADLHTKEPVTPSTVFAIQSVTKPVLATALMQWHERGCFQLDDGVAPQLAPVALTNQWEAESPVTFRGLLTHTAGLPVDFGSAAGRDASSLEDFVAAVAKTVRKPGEEIVYANYGYDMIGLLLERFARKLVADALREQVLDPLEMRSTFAGRPPEGVQPARGYYLSAVDREHHAVPHDYEEAGGRPGPAGVLLSTVEDVARFLIAQVNGGMYRDRRILREETVADMHRLHARHGQARNGMGLGFKVDESSRGRFIYHGGDGVGFTALIGACPERRSAVVLLMNVGRAHTARSVIGNAALRCLLGEGAPSAAPASSEDHELLTGRYVSNVWGYVADLTMEGGVPCIEVVSGWLLASSEPPSLLSKLADDRYLARGGFFDGFELSFAFGDDGKATSFAGGLYAFRFDRQGDVPAAGTVDESADLSGAWSGAVTSPMGPVPVALAISAEGANVSALSANDAALDAFVAERGRLKGQFDVSVPGLGDFRVFLRLHASGGKLRGNAYAQGAFGEVAMPAELRRPINSLELLHEGRIAREKAILGETLETDPDA